MHRRRHGRRGAHRSGLTSFIDSSFERFTTSGVNERYGVKIVYGGTGHASLAAAEGGDWDMVALVSYPSRRHFVDMVNDPDYQEFEHLRAEAVSTAVLQPTTPAI